MSFGFKRIYEGHDEGEGTYCKGSMRKYRGR